MTGKTVFVSYSHRDKDLLGPMVAQLKALQQAGLLDVWVDTRIDAGETWCLEIEAAMQRAAVAVCLVSEHFLSSDFCTKEEVPFLLKRAEQDGLLIIPVLLSDCPWYAHRWVEERQMLPGGGQSVRTDYPTNPAAVFSKVAKRIHDKFNDPNYQPPKPVLKWAPLAAERVSLERLPETGSALFGRDEELELLDQAWSGELPSPTRVLAFTAHGGVGKSTLINHWLGEMKRDHYRGATRVFGWSFYSQGVREQGSASADTFVAEALKFFGDPAMAASPTSAWDKGARLARLIGAERALLVLDGMEPLQASQQYERGKLRDPALESLLRGLAKQSTGLCLITTRESIPDLAKKPGFAERDLETISPEAGRALLRTARVIGTDAELESLAERFGPHALAISLLGVYLHEQHGHGIGPAQKLEQMPGPRPIDRVLAGFEQWLGDSAECEVLQLLGLFDRPADPGCLQALCAQPAIHGLSDRVASLGDDDWNRVLIRLEKLRLIHTRQSDSGERFVDAHPLIREHFAEQLRETNSEAWRAAHRRLYEHFCATTKEGDKPTLEDLQPLYQAVAHGCQAGLHQEAYFKVFEARILRGNKHYSWRQLGAFGADLAAVAWFFEEPWNRPSASLDEDRQSFLVNHAAICLRALSCLVESLEPMRISGEMDAKVQEWTGAAISYGNLSELELTLGEVAGAVRDAERSVSYADLSSKTPYWSFNRTTYADALHQAGRQAEAETRFQEAERMQAEHQPTYPLLYSLWGFRYCDLLLAAPERAAWQVMLEDSVETVPSRQRPGVQLDSCRAVSQRAVQTLKWFEAARVDMLSIVLDHLTLGRTALYVAILEGADFGLLTPDLSHIDTALDGLRRAGTTHHIPRGLLTRAWLRFLTGAPAGHESAQADLDEAWEIAERGPMPLFLADIHLYRARLFGRPIVEGGAGNEVEKYPWESPAADLAEARRLIEKHGYHRRDEELADAEAALKRWANV